MCVLPPEDQVWAEFHTNVPSASASPDSDENPEGNPSVAEGTQVAGQETEGVGEAQAVLPCKMCILTRSDRSGLLLILCLR